MKALLLCDDTEAASVAPLCQRYGVGVEVQAFYDPEVIEQPRALPEHERLIEGITPRGLHGPFGDLCPGSFDPMVRDVARTRFEQAYSVAQQLGAEHIVLHHGYVPGTSGHSNWLKRSAAFWHDFILGKEGVRVHVENMLEHDPELLADVIDAVDSPALDICFDTGHAHCNGRVAVLDWIERLGSRIGYVHLHNNHGSEDEHLGLGDGTIPMEDVLAALEDHAPDALWAIEAQVPYLEASLAWLAERGYVQDRRAA